MLRLPVDGLPEETTTKSRLGRLTKKLKLLIQPDAEQSHGGRFFQTVSAGRWLVLALKLRRLAATSRRFVRVPMPDCRSRLPFDGALSPVPKDSCCRASLPAASAAFRPCCSPPWRSKIPPTNPSTAATSLSFPSALFLTSRTGDSLRCVFTISEYCKDRYDCQMNFTEIVTIF